MSVSPRSARVRAAATSRHRINVALPSDFITSIYGAVVSPQRPLRHHYAKLAEALFTQLLPAVSAEIRTVGARKGKSGVIAAAIAPQLGGSTGAALVALWSVRSARLVGMREVFRAAAHLRGFGSTLNRLLGKTGAQNLIGRIDWQGGVQW